MVERNPVLTFASHLVLIIGVFIVAFPLYITFVASTQTAEAIVQSPMPMLPGGHMVENYRKALLGEGGGPGSKAPVARMMFVSLVTAVVIAVPRSRSRCCRRSRSSTSAFASRCSSSGLSSSR